MKYNVKHGSIVVVKNNVNTINILFVDMRLNTYLQNLLKKLKLQDKIRIEPINEGKLIKTVYKQILNINDVSNDIIINGRSFKIKKVSNHWLYLKLLNIMLWFIKK